MTTIRAKTRQAAGLLSAALMFCLAAGAASGAEGDLAAATWPGAGFAAAPTIPGGGGSVGQAVAVQPDGKVVVAGYASVSGNNELVLVRYLTTGGLDTTFGTNGVVVDGALTPGDIGYYVALQASGAIDVAGFQTQAGRNVAALVQYTPAGARDATFGLGGVAASLATLPDLATSSDVVYNSVAVQPLDGRIVCVGRYYDVTNGRYTAMAVRYTTTGALDGTFGSGGAVEIRPIIVEVNGNVFGNHVLIEPDGHILGCGTAGQTTNNMMAFRLTTNGFLDAGFGSNGVQTVQFAAGVASKGTFIDLQADGKAVCVGSTGSPLRFAIARFTTTGQLDTTYGSSSGTVTLPAFVAGSTAEECTANAVQWDGKTVLYGYSASAGTSQVVARLTTTGALDTTFGSGGATLTSGANITNGAAITALTTSGVAGPNPNHQLVVTGQNAGGSLFAARYILDTTAPVTAITAPANNSSTNDQTPPVAGTSEPYASVLVFADGSLTGSATASATGTWSLAAIATTLAPGAHTLTASALDAAGNQGALSPPVTITIDLTPPTIVSVTPGATSSAVSPFTFTVTFSEPVAALTAANLAMSNASDATTISTGNGTVWTVTVVPTQAGVVTLTIPAGSAQDFAGNLNTDSKSGSELYTGTGGVATTAGGTTGGGTSQAGFIDNGGSSHSKCGLGGGLMGFLMALLALRRRQRAA